MKIDQTTVAVITGAASGIGRALAERLAQSGAALAIADVNEAGLDETARLAQARGVKVSKHIVDVADNERVAAFAQEVLSQHGRANLLINNAGVALAGKVEEISIADIEWVMSVNFWGVVYGVKHFLPILKQQPQAHLVNISSVFGLIGPPEQAAYSASKFAVRGFTESLRHEMAGSNVTVSTVHPGGIKTNIARSAKLGANAPLASLERDQMLLEKVAKTSPEQAAERIVRGVLNNQARILIGPDAFGIDHIQRWMPVKYWALLGKLIEAISKQ